MLTRRRYLELLALAGLAFLPWLSACASCGTDAPAVELVPGEDLYAVWYSCGGGGSGGSEQVELTRSESGGAVLTWSSKEWWDAPEKSGKKRLDASAFDEFSRMVEEYDLRAASEQPDSELVALDADTSKITFAYVGEDGDMDVDSMFSIDQWQELTDGQREGFWAAIKAIKDLVP